MELLLKRNETPSAFGTRYDLFAKLELTPEELSRIRKANPEKTLIVEDDPRKAQLRWRLCLIPGGIAAFILGVIAFYAIHPLMFLPVAVIGWFAMTKLFFNQVRPFITVSDIITGRTIHCKSTDELYVKENEIKEKIQNYCNYLEGMHSLGNEQRIDLSRG
jgi:hypothetical protein